MEISEGIYWQSTVSARVSMTPGDQQENLFN